MTNRQGARITITIPPELWLSCQTRWPQMRPSDLVTVALRAWLTAHTPPDPQGRRVSH